MHRYVKELAMFAAAIGLLLTGLWWLRPTQPSPAPTLKMTAGDATGLRHKLALEFAKEARRHGIVIQVQPSRGSEEAVEGVKNGDFDLAFVQGGISTENVPTVRQLTAMHIEPLHLLVKPSLLERIESAGLREIEGCTVNVGPAGSGTQILATEVLKFAGLRASSASEPQSYRAVAMNYQQLMETNAEQLPDAIFTVSTLPSVLADFMIEKRDYRLVALPFGEALSLEAFLQLGESSSGGMTDKRHLFETRIPAFTYSVNRSEPPQPLTTIGTRLLLIANTRVSNQVVTDLLDSLYNSNFAHAERPPLDATLLDLPSEFPLHSGSILYRQRNKPLIAGDAIDYWEKVLAIAATLAGGTFFLVQWYLRWSQRKREASFAMYIRRVLAIENAAMQTELSAKLDLPELIRLQRELAELKADAVSKFASGELEGEGLVHGFLALVNDARNQLTRLILHERENIEEQAAKQHTDANRIWLTQADVSSPDK